MLTTTPDKVRWIDTVRDCGRAFAAGAGVVSGEGVYVCDAKDGAAVPYGRLSFAAGRRGCGQQT